ncbi:MAG: HD domain-containing protein [Baekduia sp.]
MLVREFEDGQQVDQVLLVREVERRTKRDGASYLRLTLGDRSGALTAMVWDDVTRSSELCRGGHPVHVTGRFERHPKWGAQVSISELGPAQIGSFDLDQLTDGPERGASAMERDLRDLVATVENPHIVRLLGVFFGEQSETWALYRVAPAAKRYHQAYVHGLLEHCLTVAQAVSATAPVFPGIDRDVAVCGALLHDIGKLEAYTCEGPIDLTDEGRLLGEIPLGYYRVRSEIEALGDFPAETAKAILHIILSHHGKLEHGSPVVPCTREATLVHMMDNLGGRLGSFDRLEKELMPGETWSSYDRALGGGAYFSAADEQPITIRAEDRRDRSAA